MDSTAASDGAVKLGICRGTDAMYVCCSNRDGFRDRSKTNGGKADHVYTYIPKRECYNAFILGAVINVYIAYMYYRTHSQLEFTWLF